MEKVYLNIKEVSIYIGRSEQGVRNLARRKKIPFRYVGGRRLLFIKKDIDAWIENSEGLSLESWHENNKLNGR